MVEARTKRIKLGDKTVSEISWFDKIMPAVCRVCQLENFSDVLQVFYIYYRIGFYSM